MTTSISLLTISSLRILKQSQFPFVFLDTQHIIHTQVEAEIKKKGCALMAGSKARRANQTTYFLGRMLWMCLTKANQNCAVIAHEVGLAIDVLELIRFSMEHLPVWLQPETDKNNTKYIKFSATGSSIKALSTKSAGRGRGYHAVILTEFSWWENAARAWVALQPTFSMAPGSFYIVDTTSNGAGNEHHRLCMLAKAGIGRVGLIFIPSYIVARYNEEPDKDFVRTTAEDYIVELAKENT